MSNKRFVFRWLRGNYKILLFSFRNRSMCKFGKLNPNINIVHLSMWYRLQFLHSSMDTFARKAILSKCPPLPLPLSILGLALRIKFIQKAESIFLGAQCARKKSGSHKCYPLRDKNENLTSISISRQVKMTYWSIFFTLRFLKTE